MCPNIDLLPATANTLAIIQGKESLSSLIDELDFAQYEQVYTIADSLNRDNHISTKKSGQYEVVKHSTMWTRRVR